MYLDIGRDNDDDCDDGKSSDYFKSRLFPEH